MLTSSLSETQVSECDWGGLGHRAGRGFDALRAWSEQVGQGLAAGNL